MSIFVLLSALKTKLLNFHIRTPTGKTKKETHELYKQEKGKRKVKNSAAVFVDVSRPSRLRSLSTCLLLTQPNCLAARHPGCEVHHSFRYPGCSPVGSV